MATIPAGRLSRGVIIDQALTRAGNTKLRSQARVRLNFILDELYLDYDWPFLRAETTLSLTGSPFALPDNFLQTYDDAGLLVTATNGTLTRHRVIELSREKFELSIVEGEVDAQLPRIWTVERGGAQGLLWPVPTSSCAALLRYKSRPPFMDTADTTAYDADIPLFSWASYLSDALYQWALEHEKDSRADAEMVKLERKLDRIRTSVFPLHSLPEDIGLDPATFTRPYRPEG